MNGNQAMVKLASAVFAVVTSLGICQVIATGMQDMALSPAAAQQIAQGQIQQLERVEVIAHKKG
jgi:hypothetical protein